MSEAVLITGLGIFASIIVFQQLFFAHQLNKLLNKFMSRNYSEYEQTKTAARAASEPVQGGLGSLDLSEFRPESHLEDIRVLEGLQLR